MTELVLVRHGETEWSRAGRHTGRTDLPLTARGEDQARRLAGVLSGRPFGLVLTSPLQRARATARLAGLSEPSVDPDLVEWDYGAVEGRTTAEMSAELGRPWWIWADGVGVGESGGESVEDVARRATRVLDRARPVLDTGADVVLVAHGHVLRILTAVWLELPPRAGALFALSAGSLSRLGFEHARPAILAWNVAED